MTYIYDKRLRDDGDNGYEDIRVSRWSDEGLIYLVLGEGNLETRVTLSPKTACRLGWALLDAESSRPRLEPDEVNDPVQP